MKALVPVKRYRFAKQRLAAIVPTAQRERLARAMAEHVLQELAQSQVLSDVAVVTAEPTLTTFARELGFEILADRENGLNSALQGASEHPAWRDANDVAIIHADLPLFSHAEFDRVATIHLAGRPRQLTLVADNAGQGTNVRFCRPGFAVPMLFGIRSADRHQQAAAENNLAMVRVENSALSFDCDVVSDIPRILDDPRSFKMPDLLHALLSLINISASVLEDIAS